ncbi:MAG: PGN_0703 family putative restriction endonuclease [Muribaculaceae bacterium]
MTKEEIIDQMRINAECGVLGDLKEYLSYSSANPERHFVKTDNAFTRKARLLQAIRRWQSGAECGSFERKGITYFHPNLSVGGEQSGCNFLHPVIFNYAKFRVRNKKAYETIEEERLFNNFLSSQPMAFNLFVPLMEIIKCEEGEKRLASAISKLLDPNEVLGIERIYDVGLEFIPDYYSKCLNDRTAMDAYMRYTRPDGKRGIIAIETKYTDKLGTNQASNPSTAIKAATEIESIAELFTEEGKSGIKSGISY